MYVVLRGDSDVEINEALNSLLRQSIKTRALVKYELRRSRIPRWFQVGPVALLASHKLALGNG